MQEGLRPRSAAWLVNAVGATLLLLTLASSAMAQLGDAKTHTFATFERGSPSTRTPSVSSSLAMCSPLRTYRG